tara:strand:+ start:3001 stop:5148 length:2148 start_codon:yes stop_codon:yes gene_type:complete
MAERRPSAGSSALNQVEKNYKYGGDTALGVLIPERREILREEIQNQLIGYDDRGQEIRQTIPAQYGESEVDFSYSPIVRGAKATGSFLNDIFFGDANEQSEAAGRAVSAVRGVVGGLVDYAVDQYQAGMAGGTTYDPETRQITEFDPTAVLLSNAPAGIQAVRNAPPNTMTLGAAGGRMNPTRNIDTEVSQAKAAYDLDPNNEELRQSYMALRRERDLIPSLPRIRRGRGSAIRVFHGSPHEFENFSMSNIGTGEGAQAYGYGLYFAESPAVARSYRDQLSQGGSSIGGRPIMDDYNSIIERADRLPPAAAQIEYDKAAFLEDLELTDDIAESISRIENPEVAKWARSEVAPQFKPAGYSYEANLNVTTDDLLDWDKPLSEQSEKVQNALGRNDKWTTGASFYRLKSGAIDDQLTEKSGELYDFIQSHPKFNAEERNFSSAEVISSWLDSKGVSGIKYYDGLSRDAKGGTSNYVIFDDSLVDTKRVNDKLTPSWMDQGARMERAQDLEFDTERTAYRGLSGEYDPNKAGNYQMFTSSPEDAGEYGSNVVSSYLRKGNNLVVDGGRNNFNSIPVSQLPDNVRANLHSSVGSVARTDDIAYAAQAAGYDSVSINNVFDKASNEIPLKPSPASNAPMSQEMMDLLDEVDASGMLNNTPDVALPPEIPRNYDPTTIDIIFDPKNIRSIEAEFDPTKADSADLLSSRQSERQMSALRGIA